MSTMAAKMLMTAKNCIIIFQAKKLQKFPLHCHAADVSEDGKAHHQPVSKSFRIHLVKISNGGLYLGSYINSLLKPNRINILNSIISSKSLSFFCEEIITIISYSFTLLPRVFQ